MFNLTVCGEHVYFANGILSSNCDALRYLCTYAKTRYGKFMHEVNPTQHVSQRDREMAKKLGIELPPEPEP